MPGPHVHFKKMLGKWGWGSGQKMQPDGSPARKTNPFPGTRERGGIHRGKQEQVVIEAATNCTSFTNTVLEEKKGVIGPKVETKRGREQKGPLRMERPLKGGRIEATVLLDEPGAELSKVATNTVWIEGGREGNGDPDIQSR